MNISARIYGLRWALANWISGGDLTSLSERCVSLARREAALCAGMVQINQTGDGHSKSIAILALDEVKTIILGRTT